MFELAGGLSWALIQNPVYVVLVILAAWHEEKHDCHCSAVVTC